MNSARRVNPNPVMDGTLKREGIHTICLPVFYFLFAEFPNGGVVRRRDPGVCQQIYNHLSTYYKRLSLLASARAGQVYS